MRRILLFLRERERVEKWFLRGGKQQTKRGREEGESKWDHVCDGDLS